MSSDPQLRELRERLAKMSDDELIRMVCEEYADYREEALEIAEEELAARGIYLEDGDAAPVAGVAAASDNGLGGMGGGSNVSMATGRAANRAALSCSACGGALRSGYLFAQKEITVLFADNNEERFVDVQACRDCGRVQLTVDYETDVESG